MEKVLELRNTGENMNNSLPDSQMSDKIDLIAQALSKAQSELLSVKKDEEGYGYNYANLASTIEVAKPVLAKNNLAITQLLGTAENGKPQVTTLLVHNSGQFIRSVANISLPDMKGCNEAQRAGSAYSYLRRYALQAILNMASEDNDATSQVKGSSKVENSAPARTKFRRKKEEVDGNANFEL